MPVLQLTEEDSIRLKEAVRRQLGLPADFDLSRIRFEDNYLNLKVLIDGSDRGYISHEGTMK